MILLQKNEKTNIKPGCLVKLKLVDNITLIPASSSLRPIIYSVYFRDYCPLLYLGKKCLHSSREHFYNLFGSKNTMGAVPHYFLWGNKIYFYQKFHRPPGVRSAYVIDDIFVLASNGKSNKQI